MKLSKEDKFYGLSFSTFFPGLVQDQVFMPVSTLPVKVNGYVTVSSLLALGKVVLVTIILLFVIWN